MPDTSPSILGEGPYRALHAVLEGARQHGYLGPGPVEAHISRSLDALALIPAGTRAAMDLGSGGGVPGLPLALALPEVRWVLLDGSVARVEYLTEAIRDVGLSDRVTARAARAEVAGRDPAMRGRFELVTARSFAPPAVTAECAAPFLAVGGRLVVAEPPGGSSERWPAEGLELLGLQPAEVQSEPSAFQVLVQGQPCPERFPRRTGVPAKRPLF